MLTMNSTELALWLRTNIEWTRFFHLIDGIGVTLNSFKNRFDKSDLLEQSIEVYSNGKIRWIDREGADLEIPDGRTMEMKYSEDCIFGKRGMRKAVKELQLLNSRGSGFSRSLPDAYSPFLMICDRRGVAMVDKETLSNFVVGVGDGVRVKGLPTSLISFVVRREELLMTTESKGTPNDYRKEKREMQVRYINQF